MNFNRILLVIGLLLVLLGIYSKISENTNTISNNNTTIHSMELSEPTNQDLKKEAMEVAEIFKQAGSSARSDGRKLRDLYLDIAKLVSLDGEDLVIKNTEEIRQANSVAGAMFRLDIKNKYPNLAKEAQDVIVASIGDDQVNLSSEIRQKAVDAFNALAWGCNEGTK